MALTHRQDVALRFDPHLEIGEWQFGGVKILLFMSLEFSVRMAERDLRHGDIIRTYKALSGDPRNAINLGLAKKAVLGDIQNAWYEASGKAIPAHVMAAQEERMAKAKAAAPESEGGEKEQKKERVTIRSIIEAGLLAGTEPDAILEEVKEHFPDSKADGKHVSYYRHFLIQAGKMEKPVKVAKAAKAEEPEDAAGPKARAGKKRSADAMKEAAQAAPAKAQPAGKAKRSR